MANTAKTLTTTVTIADSASLSGAANFTGLPGAALCGIIVPSTWTTAVLSFAASADNSTFYPVYNASGAEVVTGSITGGTAVWVALDPSDFAGIPYLKVRSGTSGTAVNQSGGDTLTLVYRTV